MIDGDEWKSNGGMDEEDSPENIALDEYSSIIEAYYEHVLRPVVDEDAPLDKDALALTESELEWKIKDPNFRDLPFKIKDAYNNFYNFVNVLGTASNEEIKACKDVLDGLLALGISCSTCGEDMKEIHVGRNPCRTEQYKTLSAIKRVERVGHSQLLEAAKQMAETCLKCPYK